MIESGCQAVKNKREIIEVDCPQCGKEESIELFITDGVTVGTGLCEACGFEIPEGTFVE